MAQKKGKTRPSRLFLFSYPPLRLRVKKRKKKGGAEATSQVQKSLALTQILGLQRGKREKKKERRKTGEKLKKKGKKNAAM